MLGRYGGDAKLLAGGQSLVPLMKLRLARPQCVIDLNGLSELEYIQEAKDLIRCGAMTRHVQFEESELIKQKLPLVAQAAAHIGDCQVRNRGTIGGALVEADPAGDWGPVVLALNAVMRCIGPQGHRSIDAKEFFSFAYTSNLRDDELLAGVDFPVPPSTSVGRYSKLEKITGDFAIVSVALQVETGEDRRCLSIGIGLGGVGVAPLKPAGVESFLLGKKIDDQVIQDASELLENEIDPLSDQRGSAEYKRRVSKVVFRRTLKGVLSGS